MSSLDKAVLAPGFAISRKSAEFLRKELTDGDYGLHTDVEIIPCGDLILQRNSFDDVLRERTVYMQSMAGLIVPCAAEVVACFGPEPRMPHQLAYGALKVAYNTQRRTENEVKFDSLYDSAQEVLRHPTANLRGVIKVLSGQSTARRIADDTEAFPGDRTIIIGSHDGFKFNNRRNLEYARSKGVDVHVFRTTHNGMFTHPKWFTRQLHAIKNQQAAA